MPGLEGTVEELMIRKMPPSMSTYILESLENDRNDLPNSENSNVESRPRAFSISIPEREEQRITLYRW